MLRGNGLGDLPVGAGQTAAGTDGTCVGLPVNRPLPKGCGRVARTPETITQWVIG
jgi:hypothetical protein